MSALAGKARLFGESAEALLLPEADSFSVLPQLLARIAGALIAGETPLWQVQLQAEQARPSEEWMVQALARCWSRHGLLRIDLPYRLPTPKMSACEACSAPDSDVVGSDLASLVNQKWMKRQKSISIRIASIPLSSVGQEPLKMLKGELTLLLLVPSPAAAWGTVAK